MSVTCTRKLQFCAGHRVLGHENKCGSWHGHEFVAEITAAAAMLDRVGRIIDFSVLKERIGGWLDAHWDHGFLVYEKDEELVGLARLLKPNHKTFVLPCNPTSENLADYLLREVCPKVLEGSGVEVVQVTLHETSNCRATASL